MTTMGVGTPGVGVSVGVTTGAGVKNTRVGRGVGCVRRNADGPIRLRMKLKTTSRLKTVVKILALRLLRALRLDRATSFSSTCS